ncbi:MAG TPA: hypothetical protein VE988_07410 [Gemmataceae bacterium]|nr:hypothetical protein [Gemmataceae bacterium]
MSSAFKCPSVVCLDKLNFAAILAAAEPLQERIDEYVAWDHGGIVKLRRSIDLDLTPLLVTLQREGLFWPGSPRPDFLTAERLDAPAAYAGQALFEWCRAYEKLTSKAHDDTDYARCLKNLADTIPLVRKAKADLAALDLPVSDRKTLRQWHSTMPGKSGKTVELLHEEYEVDGQVRGSVTVLTPENMPDVRELGERTIAREKLLDRYCAATGTDRQQAQDFALGALLAQIAYQTQSPPPPDISVDDEDIGILNALHEQAPRLCTLYDLETNANVARKTAGARLKKLIDRGLATRPNGEKRGATITAEGQELLKRCPPPK